jgi:hypothetical protein
MAKDRKNARRAADLYATAGPPQAAGAALEWVIWADVRRGTVTEVWGHRLAGQRLD